MNEDKTLIVHVRHGFEFFGYKIKRGSQPLRQPPHKLQSRIRQGVLNAYPRQKSIGHFKDQIRKRTGRKSPVTTGQLIDEINPITLGWSDYYKKAHIGKLFNRLDRWIRRRIWSHRYKCWRNVGWKVLPESKLHYELGLVSLIKVIPSLNLYNRAAL